MVCVPSNAPNARKSQEALSRLAEPKHNEDCSPSPQYWFATGLGWGLGSCPATLKDLIFENFERWVAHSWNSLPQAEHETRGKSKGPDHEVTQPSCHAPFIQIVKERDGLLVNAGGCTTYGQRLYWSSSWQDTSCLTSTNPTWWKVSIFRRCFIHFIHFQSFSPYRPVFQWQSCFPEGEC